MTGWSHSILSHTSLTRTWVRIPLQVVDVGPATGRSLIQRIEPQSIYTIRKHSKLEASQSRGLLSSLNAVALRLIKGIRNIACLKIPEFTEGSDKYHRKFRFEWFVLMPVMSPEISTLRCRSIYIFIYLVVCLTTGPKPLPKRALHIVRSRASSFK